MSIKVTLDGTPLEGATVSLIQPEGHTAVGVTDASGIAVIKSTDGLEGVFPGDYTVTIKKTERSTSSTPPPGTEIDRGSSEENFFVTSRELLPVKYGSVKTSGLTVTQARQKGYFEFDITENP